MTNDPFGYNTTTPTAQTVDLSKPLGADNAANQQSQNQSFMQKLHPDKSFKPPQADTAALKRDPNMAATDLAQVKNDAAGLKANAQATKADLNNTWHQAQNQAMAMVKEVAMEQGLDLGAVKATFAPDSPSTKFNAAVTTADAFVGGGTLAMAMQGGSALNEIRNESRKLSPKEMERLMDEAHSRLSSQSQQQAQQTQVLTAAEPASGNNYSSPQWDNFEPDDLGEFLKADLGSQPEAQELDAFIAEIEAVEDNHQLVAEREYIKEGNKFAKAIEMDNEGAIAAMTENPDEIFEYTAAEACMHSDCLADINGLKPGPQEVAALDSAVEDIAAVFDVEPDPALLAPKIDSSPQPFGIG